MEYAEDGAFEDRPTQTVGTRPARHTPYTTRVEGGERVIETEALTLRYRVDSGPFGADNLTVTLRQGAAEVVARPEWGEATPNDDQLGGWLRGLDLLGTSAPLNPGVLSRRGWFLLDDSETALLVGARPGYATRPARDGAYQDGYFFGYGLDYRGALADLRALTGAAPLLPRKAFGVWFSRYWPYSGAEWQGVVSEFQEHQVPLDTLSLDTEWKETPEGSDCSLVNSFTGAPEGSPCSWNGWDWNTALFPDPEGFLAWAHEQGVEVGLNVHPSVNQDDPALATFGAAADQLRSDFGCAVLQGDPGSRCMVLDLGDPAQLEAYFELHRPIAAGGVDFWWFDWCCESTSVEAEGLTADTWINEAYLAEHRRMGSRWPAFSRIGSARGAWGARPAAGEGLVGQGAFAEHRATLHFTGDTCSTWELIQLRCGVHSGRGRRHRHAVRLARHRELPRSARGRRRPATSRRSRPCCPTTCTCAGCSWACSSRILRLHSQHGQRLPWEYTGDAAVVATDFLRLRERLVPYLYTLARAGARHGAAAWCARSTCSGPRWKRTPTPWHAPASRWGTACSSPRWPRRAPRPPWSSGCPRGSGTTSGAARRSTGGATIVRDVTLADYPVYARAGHHPAHAARPAHEQRWAAGRAHAERVGRRRRRVRPLRRRRRGLRL
jgi:hypothetical protein